MKESMKKSHKGRFREAIQKTIKLAKKADGEWAEEDDEDEEYLGSETLAEFLMRKEYHQISCDGITCDIGKDEVKIVIFRDITGKAYYYNFERGNEIEEAALAVLYADIGKFLNTNNPRMYVFL